MLVFNTKQSKYKSFITKWAALIYYKAGIWDYKVGKILKILLQCGAFTTR